MTKNNLAVHLKWLKTQGKPSYPQIAQSSSPRRENHEPQQPTPPIDESAILDDIPEDVENETDEEMARLLYAPQSARKPRLLSRPDTLPANTPSTSKKRSEHKQSSVVRGMETNTPTFDSVANPTDMKRLLSRFFPRTTGFIPQGRSSKVYPVTTG